MDFPEERIEPIPDVMPERIMSAEDSASGMMEERPYVEEAAPVAMHLAERAPEAVTLDTMRGAMASNFGQDDLDVPAFLRKRNEVM